MTNDNPKTIAKRERERARQTAQMERAERDLARTRDRITSLAGRGMVARILMGSGEVQLQQLNEQAKRQEDSLAQMRAKYDRTMGDTQ